MPDQDFSWAGIEKSYPVFIITSMPIFYENLASDTQGNSQGLQKLDNAGHYLAFARQFIFIIRVHNIRFEIRFICAACVSPNEIS